MCKTFIFVICTSTILLMSHSGLSQAIRHFVLVKGDTPNSQSCSFISGSQLQTIPIGQRLLSLEKGLSPEQVRESMGFTPDASSSQEVIQWTSVLGLNYVSASVSLDKKGALKRSLTMVTNYQQPNEKRCSWEVQEVQQDDTALPLVR